ncbi:hypothetical protein [Aminobacter sp. AP02]|uniref:hypothetical protein n=1 Tax=Aminobacter sp. AP02 TaxID=2135737 RepID=UPI000D6C9F09|nr:hypothetical protein [Aminobacter sp. AP02]PWK75744.1 hypothetical protein C8K44_103313 [Aminobacter sp. AP02]
MNVTMKLTLDGLKRALRWRAHELAEDVEQSYRGEASGGEAAAPPRRVDPRRLRERDDDRPGR